MSGRHGEGENGKVERRSSRSPCDSDPDPSQYNFYVRAYHDIESRCRLLLRSYYWAKP